VDFVESYKEIIPCLSCREHFEQVLVENPVPEADDLFKWSVDVHNIVNRRLGKPEFSYEAALVNIGAGVPPSQFDFKIVLIFVLIMTILFLILNRK
jgi:hypothetical protein